MQGFPMESEEDKIREMLTDGNKNALKRPTVDATPGPNYTCHRCGRPGHYIQHCPTNGDPAYDKQTQFRKPIGIPVSILEVADPKNMVNDAIHRMDNGLCVRIAPGESNLKTVVHKSKSFKSKPIPDELACDLCKQAPMDAYIIRCCYNSYCHGCIVEYLEKNQGRCPKCGSDVARARDLIPNLKLRSVIEAVLSDSFKFRPMKRKRAPSMKASE